MSRTDTSPAAEQVPLDPADAPSLGTAKPATETAYYLAEGPTWDPVRRRLLWVDIDSGTVLTGRLEGGAITVEEQWTVPGTAGAVAVSQEGAVVVAGTHRLHYRDADGTLRSGRELVSGDDRRFNDARPDPTGTMLAGTKGPGPEVLLRIDADEQVTVVDDDLTLSNGLGWSVDGKRMYSVDTIAQRIFVRDCDPATGATGPRRLFARIADGFPDGMAVDAEDHLWVALWGKGCVVRIAPDGALVGRVDVPAPHTSCPGFAGDDLGALVITTAQEHLDEAAMARHPLSGRLFTFVPGVPGAPPRLWSGIVR
ncbi:MAG TPA: SMP-30/gluconolactonase/LRE family protein [Microbacterium sp.]|nr:SMP-30/gluconolactonase/LRE family protein [Microbacterium sp.]